MLVEGFSSSTLPLAEITILEASSVCQNLELVQDVPKLLTSSEPFDIDPRNLMTTTIKPKELIQQTKEKGLSYSNSIIKCSHCKVIFPT